MDSQKIQEIKRLAVIGLFSDDDLREKFVLKGGNALDLVYDIAPRASIDLDISLQSDLDSSLLDTIRKRIEHGLKRTFNEKGYEVFDVSLEEQPKTAKDMIPDFWGGYTLFFKIVNMKTYHDADVDLQGLRRRSEIVGPRNKRKLKVDISKHEYCVPKKAIYMDGHKIYVYTPEMIVFEKLRAICQQTREYCNQIGKTQRTARARDFFDIYTIIAHFAINVIDPDNLELLRNIFLTKQVPLQLIATISEYRDFHRPDFASVQDTLKPNVRTRDYDYYFDYVDIECRELCKALWAE